MLTILPIRTRQISTKEKTVVSNMLRRENHAWGQCSNRIATFKFKT